MRVSPGLRIALLCAAAFLASTPLSADADADFAEARRLAFAGERGLPVTVLRLFNTIGPRQTGQYGMVVPRFVEQALTGQPITVYGDGGQRRSFTWVGDVVDAMIELAQHPGAMGEVFNVGHTKEISILDLAMLVKEVSGSSSEIQFVPFEEAYAAGFEDMPRRMPNISKLQNLIGYQPSCDLRQIVDAVVQYVKRQKEEEDRERQAASLPQLALGL